MLFCLLFIGLYNDISKPISLCSTEQLDNCKQWIKNGVEGSSHYPLPEHWKWRQYVSLKCWYLQTGPQSYKPKDQQQLHCHENLKPHNK